MGITEDMEEIAVEVFRKEIGEDLFLKSTNYIFEYLSMNKDEYHDFTMELSAVKNKDGSYSVYENEKGLLVNLLRRIGKSKNSKLMVIPMGIMRTISNWILEKYSMIGSEIDITPTIYGSLFFSIEQPEEDRLDLFLFYTGIMLIDAYVLDLNKTKYEADTKKALYVKGVKKELICNSENPKDINYDSVNYYIKVNSNKDKVEITKSYKTGIQDDDTFTLNLDDIVNTAINEFRASKG